MKKFFLGGAMLLFLCTSCNEGKKGEMGKDNSMVQKNVQASQMVSKAFETGDVSNIDSAVASDFVDHTDRGDKNRDSLKSMIKMVHATNKDMKMDLIKELADEEYVFSLMRFRGTSDGSMMPAGPYDMQAMEVSKFKDGKAIEHWEYMQPAEMMKMMEQMQGTGNAAMSKKMIGDTMMKK